MGEKRPTNEKIQIGAIFVYSCSSEEGNSDSFYQVVGKRGNTLVELRELQEECYFDESCKPGQWKIMVRPLPGQFTENSEVLTTRVCESGWLSRRVPGLRAYDYYSPLNENHAYDCGGWNAAYRIAHLKRMGKLPPRPEES